MQKQGAKVGETLPQFPLKSNNVNRDNSPPVATSTRQTSGNSNSNSTNQARFFYPSRPENNQNNDAANSFMKPKTYGRNISSTENANNSFFFQNFNQSNHQEQQHRSQSEDDLYTESYDVYSGKMDSSFHTRFLNALKKLSGQYEMDINNFNRNLNDERYHLESEIMNLSKEKHEIQALLKQKEDLISTYMRKSDELQTFHSSQVTALTERYESLNKEFQAFSTFCKDKAQILDKEEEHSLFLHKKRLHEQNKILNHIKDKLGNNKFTNFKKDSGVPTDNITESYQNDKKIIDSIKHVLTQKTINFSQNVKDHQEYTRNHSSNEEIIRNEIIDTLKGMVKSFNRDKRGSIYVKDDISKQVRDLKKNLKTFTQVIGDPKILELLESLIQFESTAINQIITRKKTETGNISNQMEDYWYAIFLPYSTHAKTLANANDYAYIDLAYIMTLLSHTDNFSFNYLLETSMLWGNRHWFYIAKDSLFNKYILGKLDPEIEKSISDSILQILKRPDNFKSGGEILEFFDSFCGHLPHPIESETGNNLWHLAALNNNGLMIDYLTSHEEYYPSLKAQNNTGKTALDLCGPEVKEKLVWATVFQLASEAFDLYRQSHYTEACNIYLKAIKLSEDLLDLEGEHSTKMSRENLAKLYTNKAKALIQLGDWLEAIEDCEKSLYLNSDLKSVYFTLITLYENLLDWKSALDVCNRLFEKFKVYERTKMAELREQLNATRFQILQIPSTATTDEIKRSYLKMCKIWHPDKVMYDNPNIQKRHQNHFNRINEAKDFLENQLNRQTESNKKESKYLAPKPSEPAGKNLLSAKSKPKEVPSTDNKNKLFSSNEKSTNLDERSPGTEPNTKSKVNQNKETSPGKKPSSKDKEKGTNNSKPGETPFPKMDANFDNTNDIEDKGLSSISDEQLKNNLETIIKSMKYFLQDRQAKEEELIELQQKKKENPNYNSQLESIVSKEVASLASRYEKKAKEHQKLSAEIERRANTTSNINKRQSNPTSHEKSPSISEFIFMNSQDINKDFLSKDENIFTKQSRDNPAPQKDSNQFNNVNNDTNPRNSTEIDSEEFSSNNRNLENDNLDLNDFFYSPIDSPLSKYANPYPSLFESRRLKDTHIYNDPFDDQDNSFKSKLESSPSQTMFPPFPDSQTINPEFPNDGDTFKFFDSESPECKKNSKKSLYSSNVTTQDKSRELSPNKKSNSNIEPINEQDKYQDDISPMKSTIKNKISTKPTKRKKSKNLVIKHPTQKLNSEYHKSNLYNLIPSVHDNTLFYSNPTPSSRSVDHTFNDTIAFDDPHSSYATESEPENKSNEHMFSAPYKKFSGFESEDLKFDNSTNNEPLLPEYDSFTYGNLISEGYTDAYDFLSNQPERPIFEHLRDITSNQSNLYKNDPNQFTEFASFSPQS